MSYHLLHLDSFHPPLFSSHLISLFTAAAGGHVLVALTCRDLLAATQEGQHAGHDDTYEVGRGGLTEPLVDLVLHGQAMAIPPGPPTCYYIDARISPGRFCQIFFLKASVLLLTHMLPGPSLHKLSVLMFLPFIGRSRKRFLLSEL